MSKIDFSATSKYFLSASFGFILDFLLYSILVIISFNVFLANTLSFITGMTVNLFLIRKYVFKSPKFSIKKDYFFTLILNGILFLVGMVSLWIMIYLLEFNVFISKILSNALTFFLNLFSRIKFFNNVL